MTQQEITDTSHEKDEPQAKNVTQAGDSGSSRPQGSVSTPD